MAKTAKKSKPARKRPVSRTVAKAVAVKQRFKQGLMKASKPEVAARPEFAARMERLLLKRRQDLVNFQKRSESPELDLDNAQGDVIDQSMGGVAWHAQESVNHNVARELKRIDLALHRVESGRFGICESCEEKIPQARLRARPDATLCVACQESAERDESLMARSYSRAV